MARDSSGSYALPSSNPVVTLTTIASAWANATLADVAAELTNSLDRNGRGAMLGALQAASGSLIAPGVTWASETGSGWYRGGAADFRFGIASTQVAGITVAGLQQMDGAGNFFRAGFREVPVNIRSAAYTVVPSDCGKEVRHPATDVTARIWTIQATATSAWPEGAIVTFVNKFGAGIITITPTDPMRLAGTASTGNRTLAANGTATALWDAVELNWMISGPGLT